MSSRVLRFYFDYLSPYGYLAWQDMPAIAGRYDLRLEPTPILLAGLLNHHGHKGPAEIPSKRRYMFRDCIRRAAARDVPFNPPFTHPFHPLLSLRATLLDMEPAQRIELVTRLFAATWAEGRDVSTTEVVGTICEELGIPDALERVQDPMVKQKLRDVTTEAIDRGVFGVPSMMVDDELFWGSDSLEHFEDYLSGQDPVAKNDYAGWDAVQSSATRPAGKL